MSSFSSSSSVDYSLWSPASSSSSASSSPVHKASLVDPSTHSSELLQLVDVELSQPVIEYVVDCISDLVDDALTRAGTAVSQRSLASHRKFTAFVSKVLYRSEVAPATILVFLAYLDRAGPSLHIAVEKWAHERVFLGALVCAAKYANDSSLKNVHWALCTDVFGKRDIGRMESEFLQVLEWRLGVSEADVLAHYEGIMSAVGVRFDVGEASNPRSRTHRRHTSASSSSSSAGSIPSLSPPSARSVSPSPSPTVSPRTPPLHLQDVPMDVDADVDAHTHYPPLHPAIKPGCFTNFVRSLPISIPGSRRASAAVPVPARRAPLPPRDRECRTSRRCGVV